MPVSLSLRLKQTFFSFPRISFSKTARAHMLRYEVSMTTDYSFKKHNCCNANQSYLDTKAQTLIYEKSSAGSFDNE